MINAFRDERRIPGGQTVNFLIEMSAFGKQCGRCREKYRLLLTMAYGFHGRGSLIVERCSWLEVRGSWVVGRGSLIVVRDQFVLRERISPCSIMITLVKPSWTALRRAASTNFAAFDK